MNDVERFIARPLIGRTLASDRDSTLVLEELIDDGSEGARPIAPRHRHMQEDEAWYVLEGRLGFRLGDEEVEAHEGEAVLGPRGLAHTYWNPGPGPVRYLLVMGPLTARLLEALHDGTARNRVAIEELFRSFSMELLD